MPSINEFSQGVVVPQYQPTDYSSELEMALLMKKQSQYNSIVQRLSNAQSTALNISMLNLKGKQKLNDYNEEINEMLSKDLGDLTIAGNQARAASIFNKISKDDDLKRRSQLSFHYQKQMNTIDQMRNAKDPTKSGYNAVNETVFRKWTGGVEDFMLADDVNGWESKMQSYTPYKDIDQKLVNLTKLLHAEEKLVQKPVTQKIKVKQPDGSEKEMEVPAGYDVLESTKGVSNERIRTLLEKTLDQDELTQFEILSKYRILQNNTPEGLSGLYQGYNRWLKSEHTNTKKQLEQIKGLKLQLDPSKVDPNLSAEEQAVKKALYQSELDKLNEQEQYLNTKLTQQLTNDMTQEEWLKLSPNEILPFVNQLTIEGYVNGVADSLSWKNEIQKVGMDETYFANLKFKGMQDRLALDAELGRARIKLAEIDLNHKLMKSREESIPNFSAPADIVKSETSLFDTWDAVIDIQKSYNNRTTPLITSRNSKGEFDFDPKNLTNNGWLDNNKDNHEVRLWNTYVSKYRNSGAFLDENQTQPNIAGFDLFKKQVLNGDFKTDPVINNIVNDMERDGEISSYLNGKVVKVAQAVNNSVDYKQASIGDHTLEDYARLSGWTPDQGEMYFGIRNDKGGYDRMTWSEIKQEISKEQSADMDNYPAAISAARTGTYQPIRTYKSRLDVDPNFKSLVGKAMEVENQSKKMIEDIYLNEMPQFLQGKQSISSDPKTITQYIGYLNEATKLAGEDTQMGLTPDYVAQISVPSGIGEYGYFILTKEGAKVYENRKLVGVDGKPKTPVEGEMYRFKPPVQNQYDILLNAKFNDTGFVSKNIQGYKVTINDVKGEGVVKILISGPDVNKEIDSPKRDVSLIFKEVENTINMLNVKPK